MKTELMYFIYTADCIPQSATCKVRVLSEFTVPQYLEEYLEQYFALGRIFVLSLF